MALNEKISPGELEQAISIIKGRIREQSIGKFNIETKQVLIGGAIRMNLKLISNDANEISIHSSFGLPKEINQLPIEYQIIIVGDVGVFNFNQGESAPVVNFEITGSVTQFDVSGKNMTVTVNSRVRQIINARAGATVIVRESDPSNSSCDISNGATLFCSKSINRATLNSGSRLYVPGVHRLKVSDSVVITRDNNSETFHLLRAGKIEAIPFNGDRDEFLPTEEEPIKKWRFEHSPVLEAKTFSINEMTIRYAENDNGEVAYRFVGRDSSDKTTFTRIVLAKEAGALDTIMTQCVMAASEQANDDLDDESDNF